MGQKGTTVTGLASILPANLQARILEVEGVREEGATTLQQSS